MIGIAGSKPGDDVWKRSASLSGMAGSSPAMTMNLVISLRSQ
jgi:hypothetical protein